MSPREEDIRALERAVLQEATAEAQRLVSDAREKVDTMRREAQAELDAQRLAIVTRAETYSASLLEQTIAEARVEAQSIGLQRRELLLDQVFADSESQIKGAAQWPNYGEIARFLVRDAAARLESDALVISADQGTALFLDGLELSELAEDLGIRLMMGDLLTSEAEGTGITASTPDGRRRYDNTLESRLARMHDRLRAPVFRILMGEKP